MTNYDLPKAYDRYLAGMRTGDPLDDVGHAVEVFPGITYQLGNREECAAIDPRTLAASEYIYTNNEPLTETLNERGITQVSPLVDVLDVVDDAFGSDELIWGFAGDDNANESFRAEGNAIWNLFARAKNAKGISQLPQYVVNDGSRNGVIGLSTSVASTPNFKVPSIGFTSLSGLRETLPQQRLVIAGNTSRRCDLLAGVVPDAVFCFGGYKRARRQCEAAAMAGTPIVMFNTQRYEGSYLPSSWRGSPALVQAYEEERLIIREPEDSVPSKVDRALEVASLGMHNRRAHRFNAFSERLEDINNRP